MKELSVEQKAKAYDEVIEKLREFYRDYDTVSGLIDVKEELANRFPELKESMEEKIIKAIKYGLDHVFTNNTTVYETTKEQCLSWVEKQGKKEVDPRYENLEELLVADNIYQMAMNEAMVEEAKSKAINALSELAISKLLGLENQGEQDTMETQSEEFDNNIITRDDEILQAISIGLTDVAEDAGRSNFGGLPIEEIQDWLEKQVKGGEE